MKTKTVYLPEWNHLTIACALLLGCSFVWAIDVSPESYNASGSTQSMFCTAAKNSAILKCPDSGDFAIMQDVMIKQAGFLPHGGAYNVTPAPTVSQNNNATGNNTYCYRVAVADPFQGIQAASPSTCIANQPAVNKDHYVSVTTKRFTDSLTMNGITPPNAPAAPFWQYDKTIPIYLFYASLNGAPFELIDVNNDPNRDVTIYHSGETRPNGDFGGWPQVLPDAPTVEGVIQRGNLFSKITTIRKQPGGAGNYVFVSPAPQISGVVEVLHDDTRAFQAAIDDLGLNGGGALVLQSKTYNIQRPSFGIHPNSGQTGYTSDLYSTSGPPIMWWGGSSLLHISTDTPTDNLSIVGGALNQTSTIKTGPDTGGSVLTLVTPLTAIKGLAAVDDPDNPISILPANKGDFTIRLANPADAARIGVGSDIFLFTGAFNPASPVNNSNYVPNKVAQSNNYMELNTVTEVSSDGVITLALPLTKKYWFDGYNSFGFSPMSEKVPRNISFKNITLDTYERIFSAGPAFNVGMDHVTSLHPITGNAIGSGYKRGLSITNSTWSFGNGLFGWSSTSEIDKASDITFTNNTIRGYATKFSEGSSQGAKLSFTEGTSNLHIANNHFIGVQLLADEVDDVLIENNQFEDSIAWIGTQEFDGWNTNWGHVSFGSQHNAEIINNSFTVSDQYGPGWVISIGNFDGNASVLGNNIQYNQPYQPQQLIFASSGLIADNVLASNVPPINNQRMSTFITVRSDLTPNRLVVRNNTMTGQADNGMSEFFPQSSIDVPLDFCVTGNKVNGLPNDFVYVRHSIPFFELNYDFKAHCGQ